MSTYGLKYYAEVQNFRKQFTRVEILQRDLPSGTTPLQIGDVCGLVLELQGGQDDVFAPIVKTQARLSMISSDDKPTAGGIKYGGWGEFYTPDATLYKVVIKTRPNQAIDSWITRWTGYITPDSWQEGLEYRAPVTITARDNIGHLQDFEFDMQGDTYGLVKISDLITAAMEKVSMPMTLSLSTAPEYLEIADHGRKKLIDAYVVVSNFKEKDWYQVLEGVLDSIGYTLRYTDNNRVTLAPIRHLPLMGEGDRQDQPQMTELEFYGGTGEQVPAVKMITDEHSYDYAGEVFLPILGNFSFGPTQTYREYMEGNILPGGGKQNKVEHDAFFNKLTNAAGTVWETESDMLNTSLYRHDARLPEGWDQYAFLPINGIDSDIRTQTLSFLSRTTDITIRCVFSPRPIDVFGSQDWLTDEANSLYRIRYAVRYEKGGVTRYMDIRGEWVSSLVTREEEFDAQNEYATELLIKLNPCTELGDGGRIYLSFDGIWYKHWAGGAVQSYGDYARLASVSVAPNSNNLSRSTVKTVNDEKYNILLDRKPMLSPLSIDSPFCVPENYGTALFYYPSVGDVPKAYPFLMNWCTVSANVEKPLPVFIHQQILCYRGANLWELSGDCAPGENDSFKFNTLCEYKGRTYILMSGTFDFIRGTIDGAILREFLEYDDLWDDTVQPDPGEPGSWSGETTYPGGGTPGSSTAGSSSAGGGGINIAVSEALQSFQSQIDSVSARNNYDELTATVVSSDVLTATEAYMGYAHASRYYLTDSIYFWSESVNGVMCVRLNAPLITAGDQIVISGTPGGGGGGGASYLDELLDVTITLPANGQTLFYQDGEWVNGNIDFSNYYTKAQVDDIIGTIQQFHYEVYASLEDVSDPQNNVLYLIGPTGSGEDKYEEYVYSGGWVKIGDTSIDLSGYVQTTRLDADEAIIAEAIQSLQSQIDAVSARDNYDELTASSLYADMLAATYAYAERYYLTDGVFFYIETVNGIPCVKLNAPFITEGDQVIISGTPGGGGGGGITLYDYDQVKAMTADVALTAPSAWAMHQMWAEIFGGASSVLTSGNYTNYVNTTNFPGLDKVGTVTSVATGTGLTGGPITASGTISIDPTYLGYISHGETAYGWGDILTQAIQSLQSQIDSVSARNNYDELTASAFFGDMVSASALYAGRIELAGEDLGTAVTGICSRLSSVENKFDTDGSALSAVKLKTSRNIWGRPFDGTADVTGDLNLNGSSILGTLGNPVLSMAGMNGNYWVALGSMYFETSRYNPMIVGHTYISGSSATPSSIPSETLFVNGTSAFDGNVEIKTGRTLTIGGAVFTWVPAEGDTPGYLRLSTAFVTEGDQIILSGEPGGGGQGVGYLYELEDVSDELATPTTGMVLYYDGTEWIGVAATEIGGVTSVVGASGDVTATQIIDAITEEGLPWSAITEKPTTLAGYGITDAATASSVAALTTRVGTLESDETIISIALQSLQSQVDSVSARNEFDELTATVLFADTLSATSAYIGNITGHLSGNADTASYLVGSSYGVGSANQGVYFSGGLPVACTYAQYASLYNGAAGRLAYYAGANLVSDFYNTIGGAYQPMYLNAGVPTACTYTLNAALLASSTAGRLAYYSGTNAVSEYYGTIGGAAQPMYLNAGVPTASTSTVGSASLPVYLNAGTITACTATSMFSALGSNLTNNLEVTIFGQLRYVSDLYATYDGEGEVIGDKFTIVSNALRSLQSQIDSVAARHGFDSINATNAFFDMVSVGSCIYAGELVTSGDQSISSDETLKVNLKDIELSAEEIAKARAVTFDWKDGHGSSFGTIAQDWKDILPQSVIGSDGGYSFAYAQAGTVIGVSNAREIVRLKERVRELEEQLRLR